MTRFSQPSVRSSFCLILLSFPQGVETGAGSEEELGGSGPPGVPAGGAGSYGSTPRATFGQSLFDYIDKQHQKSPVFYNFLYTPDLDNPVSWIEVPSYRA